MNDILTTLINADAIQALRQSAELAAVYKLAKPVLSTFLGPAAQELAETGRDYVKQLDWVKQLRANNALVAAKKQLDDAQIDAQPVPIKVLLPLLENCALEDDSALRHAWATLLANAANPHSKHKVEPSFVEIMRQLMPIHISILSLAYEYWQKSVEARSQSMIIDDSTYFTEIKEILPQEKDEVIKVALDNLIRLRLCFGESKTTRSNPRAVGKMIEMSTFDYRPGLGNITLTDLGQAFISVCSAPTDSIASEAK